MESSLHHPDQILASTCFLLHYFGFYSVVYGYRYSKNLAFHLVLPESFPSRLMARFFFGLNFSISLFHHIISSLRSHLSIILSGVLTASKYERNGITLEY